MLSDLQQKLLEMLKWFHTFSNENGLRYYALGGTLLGAVRHNGFIPWDDDIDIGMPRADYDKLIELMADCPNQKYELEKPLSSKSFVYLFCKLYDKSTTLIENTRYKTKRGIYLDIFPLDGIGDTLEESVKNYRSIHKRINYMSTKVCALSKHRKFYKNVAILLGRCIPEFVFGWRGTIRKIDALCRSRDFDESVWCGNLVGNWDYKEIVQRKWFGEPQLYPFEDMYLFGAEDYDSYLKNLYGDYMQLPPEDKRKSHHDYLFVDLNKPYKD